jgi:hypothetical protein
VADWRNRIVGYGEKPAGEFLANPDNWKIHTRAQAEALKAIFEKVGWIQDVIENVRTGHLLDGHERVLLAMERGEDTPVPYKKVDVEAELEPLILATFDPIGTMIAADKSKLTETLAQVQADSAAVAELMKRVSHQYRVGAALPIAGLGDDFDPASLSLAPGAPPAHIRMVQLFFTTETQPQFLDWCDRLAAEYGTTNITDTVYRAVEHAHNSLKP